jgi:hypothetical protein
MIVWPRVRPLVRRKKRTQLTPTTLICVHVCVRLRVLCVWCACLCGTFFGVPLAALLSLPAFSSFAFSAYGHSAALTADSPSFSSTTANTLLA